MQTIIDLSANGANVTSYEDAFGDYGQDQYYSEARGDARKRRQAKKLERIANRKQVALARRDLQQSKQQARIEQRRAAMASRQNISTERKRTRQERKNEQQKYRQGRKDTALQSRQARRDFAKTARVNRRNIGQEEEYNEEDPTLQNNSGTEPGYDESQDTSYGGESPQYDDTQYQDQETANDGGYVDDSEYGDSANDENYGDSTEDENYYEDTEDSFGFDGGEEFENQEYSDFDYIDVEELPIYKKAFKIEQNKEKIQQLNNKVDLLASKNRATPPVRKEIGEEIAKRTEIISNLEGQLDEFSSADGVNYDLAKLAKMKARLKRLEYKNTNNSLDTLIDKQKEECAILQSRINRNSRNINNGTKIDPKLRPNVETKPEQIIVNPQMSNASGGDDEVDIENGFNACGTCSISNGMMTGFDGGEFDEGNSSSATGNNNKPLSNVSWKGIAIGVGISALLIWGAERMKLFGGK